MIYRIVFKRQAISQLVEIYRYIAKAASQNIAQRYNDGIVVYCHKLGTFPHRGVQRSDIRPGLRITNFRKRVSIAFVVNGDQVVIFGVFYGGQSYEDILSIEENGE